MVRITKLRKIGASILWAFSLLIFAAMTFRAVALYVFGVAFDVSMNDLYIAIGAFCMMFINAEIKSVVFGALKGLMTKFTK